MITDEQRQAWRAQRRYWPKCLLEEMMPEGRVAAQAWLKPDANGETAVLWNDEEPGSGLAGTIRPNEEARFWWTEPRGYAEVEVFRDGTYRFAPCLHTPDLFRASVTPNAAAACAPDDADFFWVHGDWENCGASLEELARCLADSVTGESELVTVCMRKEGTETFLISADGARTYHFNPT